MTAVSLRTPSPADVFGTPTRLERFLLHAADGLEAVARRRMLRRRRDAERLAQGRPDPAVVRERQITDAYLRMPRR